MNSYQRRLQDIAYLKERVAQLESYLHPGMVKMLRNQLLNDKINKLYSDRINKRILNLNLRQWEINNGLRTTPGTRKLSKWEVFLLFFRQPRFVWKAWRHKS